MCDQSWGIIFLNRYARVIEVKTIEKHFFRTKAYYLEFPV